MPTPAPETPLAAPRFPLAGLLGFFTALVLIGLWFGLWSDWGKNTFFGWKALGVPAMEIPFFDLDNGVCNAYAFSLDGHDPYTDGSFNFRGILANYPPLMLHTLGPLCMATGSWRLGLLLCAGFLLILALASRRLSFGAGLLVGLAAVAGGPGLALERGNSDLLLIPLVALTVWLPGRLEQAKPWLGLLAFTLLVLLVCMLKLFPFLAIGSAMMFRNRRDRWLAALLAATACALYIIYEYELIARLLENTPVSSTNSYGLQTLSLFLSLDDQSAELLRAGLIVATNGVAYLVFMALFRRRNQPQPEARAPRWLYGLCLVGAGIFCGTYLVSANFLYRLVFPLLCLPLLFTLPGRPYRLAGVALALFALWPFLEATGRLVLWGSRIQAVSFLLQQALGLALAGAGIGWLVWHAYARLFVDEGAGIPLNPKAARVK